MGATRMDYVQLGVSISQGTASARKHYPRSLHGELETGA
jgi:hypothetical protein